MGGVKIVLKHKPDSEELVFEMPSQPYKTMLMDLMNKADEKYNGFVSVEMKMPYKPRTTGEKSQNNLVWKLITLISGEMGEDTDYVENLVKIKATAKGYPFKTIEGQIVPYSMTKINTVECSYLIDTCYEMCSFLGIVLEPELKQESQLFNPVAENISKLAEQALQIQQEIETDSNYQGDIF